METHRDHMGPYRDLWDHIGTHWDQFIYWGPNWSPIYILGPQLGPDLYIGPPVGAQFIYWGPNWAPIYILGPRLGAHIYLLGPLGPILIYFGLLGAPIVYYLYSLLGPVGSPIGPIGLVLWILCCGFADRPAAATGFTGMSWRAPLPRADCRLRWAVDRAPTRVNRACKPTKG